MYTDAGKTVTAVEMPCLLCLDGWHAAERSVWDWCSKGPRRPMSSRNPTCGSNSQRSHCFCTSRRASNFESRDPIPSHISRCIRNAVDDTDGDNSARAECVDDACGSNTTTSSIKNAGA